MTVITCRAGAGGAAEDGAAPRLAPHREGMKKNEPLNADNATTMLCDAGLLRDGPAYSDAD